jgi:hypothetical protein
MPNAKVKIVERNADIGIANMFNQMLGTGNVDPVIIVPKYNLIRSKVKCLAKILDSAVTDVILKSFPGEKEGCEDIIKYVEHLNDIEFINISPLHLDMPSSMSSEEVARVGESYMDLKSNNDIKLITLTYSNLINYEDKFSTGKDFDDSFIARIPGFDFTPLAFSKLNIKAMWSSENITDSVKRYMFTVLGVVSNIAKSVYQTINSPDVDVTEFSKVIINSLKEVKKKIPRCEKAFAKIEQSVAMLENNFDGYYKDFVRSQNPSSIIEHFIWDVSKTGGNEDPQIRMQFQRIIGYYQKATRGKIKDPRVQHIFKILSANLNDMNMQSSGVNL